MAALAWLALLGRCCSSCAVLVQHWLDTMQSGAGYVCCPLSSAQQKRLV
jgi:hypothetical protein